MTSGKEQTSAIRGHHSTLVSKLASRPSCPRFSLQHSQKLLEEQIGNVADVNQRRCLEENWKVA